MECHYILLILNPNECLLKALSVLLQLLLPLIIHHGWILIVRQGRLSDDEVIVPTISMEHYVVLFQQVPPLRPENGVILQNIFECNALFHEDLHIEITLYNKTPEVSFLEGLLEYVLLYGVYGY